MRKLLVLFLVLMLYAGMTAHAEDAPDLPGMWAVHGLPENTTFPVYSGPGEEYFVAAEGKAKVSTNGSILCYGRVGDWLMIRYSISGGVRVGYIDAGNYADVIDAYQELRLGQERYRLNYSMPITDNPEKGGKNLGTISGEVTLLAYAYSAGSKQWAYVEGVLDHRDGAKVRGFVKLDSFASAELLPVMPDVPGAEVSLALLGETTLHTDSIPTTQLRALPLADGTLALLYCDDKSTMLSLHAGTGEEMWHQRLFAASEYIDLVPEGDGFQASFYYNNQLMAYTYPLGSQEAEFSSSYPSLKSLWAAERQSDAAQLLPVPVLRAAVVGETSRGTLLLAQFDDGCGLYLLSAEGLRLVTCFADEVELCRAADENGIFTLVEWGSEKPVLRTYRWE